jgi:hypothetical protein
VPKICRLYNISKKILGKLKCQKKDRKEKKEENTDGITKKKVKPN